MTLTAYQELQNTYSASPSDPLSWDSNLAIAVTGTQLGVTGQSGCSIETVSNGGVSSCKAWFDYRTQVDVTEIVAVSGLERWAASGQDNFTQGSGGNQDKVTFVDQFQVNFVVSPSGDGRTTPSGAAIWERYGPLPINATSNGGYLFENWSTDTGNIILASTQNSHTTATVQGPGNITAVFVAPVTEPITLSLAEQQGTPANFTVSGCSVSPTNIAGDGQSQSLTALPFCQLTITAATGLGNLRYSFSSEGTAAISASVMTCSRQTCPPFTPSYFEQVSELFAYTIVGGSPSYVKAPVLSFVALGAPETYTATANPTVVWLDFGSTWSLTNPLSGSTVAERWYAPFGASSTAVKGAEQTTMYQHEYSILTQSSQPSCGSVTPPGSTWEVAGATFNVNGTAVTGCSFGGWEVSGLITIAETSGLSTSAFADSNGTLTASFSQNVLPTFPTSTLILLVGGSAVVVLAAVGVLFIRSKRLRHTPAQSKGGNP